MPLSLYRRLYDFEKARHALVLLCKTAVENASSEGLDSHPGLWFKESFFDGAGFKVLGLRARG